MRRRLQQATLRRCLHGVRHTHQHQRVVGGGEQRAQQLRVLVAVEGVGGERKQHAAQGLGGEIRLLATHQRQQVGHCVQVAALWPNLRRALKERQVVQQRCGGCGQPGGGGGGHERAQGAQEVEDIGAAQLAAHGGHQRAGAVGRERPVQDVCHGGGSIQRQ